MVTKQVFLESTTKKDRELQIKASHLVHKTRVYASKTTDEVKNMDFECHSIATVLAMVVPELKVVHGVYVGIKILKDKSYQLITCDHSWLVTPDGAILDPYPVGYSVLIEVVLVPTQGEYIHYGAVNYVPQKGIRFRITRKEINKKARMLRDLIHKAEKHFQ
jgi:hypothetical protein